MIKIYSKSYIIIFILAFIAIKAPAMQPESGITNVVGIKNSGKKLIAITAPQLCSTSPMEVWEMDTTLPSAGWQKIGKFDYYISEIISSDYKVYIAAYSGENSLILSNDTTVISNKWEPISPIFATHIYAMSLLGNLLFISKITDDYKTYEVLYAYISDLNPKWQVYYPGGTTVQHIGQIQNNFFVSSWTLGVLYAPMFAPESSLNFLSSGNVEKMASVGDFLYVTDGEKISFINGKPFPIVDTWTPISNLNQPESPFKNFMATPYNIYIYYNNSGSTAGQIWYIDLLNQWEGWKQLGKRKFDYSYCVMDESENALIAQIETRIYTVFNNSVWFFDTALPNLDWQKL